VRSLHAAEPQFSGDDGAADPAVRAALAAYAVGRGSEHAALDALAGSRLLVPVVAVMTEEAVGDSEAEEASGAEDATDVPGSGTGLRREKTTEMAMPTLIGRDGRAAVLAFTSLDALTRWRPEARPVAVPAARAWQAGAEEASAVVIDVAGPVPVTVEGARLAALAAGRPAPLPHQDPDVLAALHAALGDEPLIVQASLTTPDQRAGWEYGPRPEDLPDLGARNGAELSALGVDLPGPDRSGAAPDGTGQDSGASAGPDGTRASGDAAAVNGAGPRSAGGAGVGGAGHDALDPDAVQEMAGPDAAQQDTGQQDTGQQDTGQQDTGGQDVADLALQVTLADGCDPAAATAAVRRVAEALLTATGGRLRRGMEISVAPRRAR
jgi:SseB protein N-terminal domain